MTENPSVKDQSLPELMEPVRQRILRYPNDVWDCERCGTEDSMRIRRSTLNNFKADDILLKCTICKYAPVHGVDIEPEQYDKEVEERIEKYGRRSIDVNTHSDFIDAPDDEVKELLHSLGYLG